MLGSFDFFSGMFSMLIKRDRYRSGAGATISNVLDYAKWLRCHMKASFPLSPDGHRALHTSRIVNSAPHVDQTGFRGSDSYALGWQVNNYRGEEMYWHTGGLPGMVTLMLYLPRLQWGTIMMANGGDGSALMILMFRLLDEKLDIPADSRYDWVPFMELRQLLASETLKNAEAVMYPKAPKGKDALPLPLPIEAYSGVSNASNASSSLSADRFECRHIRTQLTLPLH